MLASIHPLGEGARRSNWWVTTAAYLGASVAGGAVLGAFAGLAGAGVASAGVPRSPALVAAVCLAAVVADVAAARVPLPSWHRQVNEDWLQRYRGWVYGGGFGFQLGLGVVTIVTTAAVYAVAALAILSGSARTGAILGAVFGLSRSLPLFAAARVQRPEQLR